MKSYTPTAHALTITKHLFVGCTSHKFQSLFASSFDFGVSDSQQYISVAVHIFFTREQDAFSETHNQEKNETINASSKAAMNTMVPTGL